MATVIEKHQHPFAAAKAAGREPYKVKISRSPILAARKCAWPSRKCPD